MSTESIGKPALVALGIAFVFVAGWAIGQSGPPDKWRGFAPKPTATINLATEIEGMSGRYLRQVLTTVEPGGASPLHDHIDQPEIIYILKGRFTEHRDGESKEYGPGEAIKGTKDTRHWVENKGSEQVVLIVTMIAKQP
jgi:quercetin dioxygenase-like cupin family protein